MNNYKHRIAKRSFPRFLLGVIRRFPSFIKFGYSIIILKIRGVTVGINTTIHPSSVVYRNMNIGDNVSIAKGFIVSNRTRKVYIGNNVIIGDNVKLLIGSHDIDSPEWENIRPDSPLIIEDYVWICPYSTILPSVNRIGKGAVIGACSVVAKDVEENEVVGGNPTKFLRRRNSLHTEVAINSLLGNDLMMYIKTWIKK